jgi:HDOD domain-containing protein
LARAAGIDSDRAYSFGLLHDIGRLGLLVAYPDAYEEVLKAADRDPISLLDLEKKRFGVDHCEAGRQLVEQWKLPSEFCVIAGRHHDAPSGGGFDPLMIAHLGCQFADTLEYAVLTPLKTRPFEELRSMLPARARDQFPADPLMLQSIVEAAIAGNAPAEQVPEMETKPAAVAHAVRKEPVETRPGESIPPFLSSQHAGEPGWDIRTVLVYAVVFVLSFIGAAYFLGR